MYNWLMTRIKSSLSETLQRLSSSTSASQVKRHSCHNKIKLKCENVYKDGDSKEEGEAGGKLKSEFMKTSQSRLASVGDRPPHIYYDAG